MPVTTPDQFRTQHGDPTTWTPVDFDVYEHLIQQATAPDFTLYMRLDTTTDPIPTTPTT